MQQIAIDLDHISYVMAEAGTLQRKITFDEQDQAALNAAKQRLAELTMENWFPTIYSIKARLSLISCCEIDKETDDMKNIFSKLLKPSTREESVYLVLLLRRKKLKIEQMLAADFKVG